MKNKKVLLFDWRFGWGLFFLVVMLVLLISSLILLSTATFVNKFYQYLGNGFWSLNHFGIHDLLFRWKDLDNAVAVIPWQSHCFFEVNIALIFLLFLVPFFLVTGCLLVMRWWWKTRI